VSALLHLRVVSPFLAFRQSSGTPAFCTVPKGAVVESPGETSRGGLVGIKLDDQSLLAFRRDLEERAEPLDGQHPSRETNELPAGPWVDNAK
jgi:hypothetical protein